jgi:hypothetical protein
LITDSSIDQIFYKFHSIFQQNPQINRASPIIHLQPQPHQQNHQNLIVQHNQHIVERQSPLIHQSNSSVMGGVSGNSGIITSATITPNPSTIDNHHAQQQQQHHNAILPSNISVLQRSSAASPTIPSSHVLNDTNSNGSSGGGAGGILKITYEKQTTNSRITALQDEGPGRRSR